jgi:hypothetical protein
MILTIVLPVTSEVGKSHRYWKFEALNFRNLPATSMWSSRKTLDIVKYVKRIMEDGEEMVHKM